jgi:very-short-patch-repair endonuclease
VGRGRGRVSGYFEISIPAKVIFVLMRQPRDKRLIEFAKTARKVPTLSEAQLWHELKSKKLNGLKFRRQHTIEPFIVDFCCPEYKLVVEVDGSVHGESQVRQYDVSRQLRLESMGYRVIRFSRDEVMHRMEWVLERIAEVCKRIHSAGEGTLP